MSKSINVKPIVIAGVVGILVGGGSVYQYMTKGNEGNSLFNKSLQINAPSSYEVIADKNLRSQFTKDSIKLNSELLDSGETSIARTRTGNAYIVTEPNEYMSSKKVHYTKWKYSVSKDVMRNTTSRTATIGNTIEFTGSMSEPLDYSLFIVCEDSDKTCQMGIESSYTFTPSISGFINKTNVNIKIDGNEIKKYSLFLNHDYTAMIADEILMNDLYQNLGEVKTLSVEFTSGQIAQIEFDISGFDWDKLNKLTYEESISKLKR